jgi:hypothetical protein
MNATNRPSPFDPSCTKLRPLTDYRDRLPSRRSGRRLNRSTLYRWALRGARGGSIQLKTVRIGGGRFTCDQYVDEFMRALAAHDHDKPQGDPIDLKAQANTVAAKWGRKP